MTQDGEKQKKGTFFYISLTSIAPFELANINS